MSRVAVIIPAYGARGAANLPAIADALWAQTRTPDITFLMTEDIPLTRIDRQLYGAMMGESFWIEEVPTPRDANGRYAVIPYSLKTNRALDTLKGDDWLVAYLTDDSIPHPEKYERMARALDENPEWGAVYCGQRHPGGIREANRVIADAHSQVDHSQVMHRLTADRWPTDVRHIKVGDAEFWRALHRTLGPFHPVPEVLDETTPTSDGITSTQ